MKSKKASILLLVIFFSSLLFAQNKPDALKEYNAGNYKTAIEICEVEIKDNPKNLDSYAVLCWSLVKNKQYTEAEFWATKARKESTYDHRIIEILAEAKYYQGKNTEALYLFQEYVSLVPSNGSRLGSVYAFMGEIYIKLAKYQHADIAYSHALRIEPLREEWWTRLGYSREMTRNYSLAIIAYNKALELSPFEEDAIRGRERAVKQLQ